MGLLSAHVFNKITLNSTTVGGRGALHQWYWRTNNDTMGNNGGGLARTLLWRDWLLTSFNCKTAVVVFGNIAQTEQSWSISCIWDNSYQSSDACPASNEWHKRMYLNLCLKCVWIWENIGAYLQAPCAAGASLLIWEKVMYWRRRGIVNKPLRVYQG